MATKLHLNCFFFPASEREFYFSRANIFKSEYSIFEKKMSHAALMKHSIETFTLKLTTFGKLFLFIIKQSHYKSATALAFLENNLKFLLTVFVAKSNFRSPTASIRYERTTAA